MKVRTFIEITTQSLIKKKYISEKIYLTDLENRRKYLKFSPSL